MHFNNVYAWVLTEYYAKRWERSNNFVNKLNSYSYEIGWRFLIDVEYEHDNNMKN